MIRVYTEDGTDTYPDATKYVVDDHGHLHIPGGNGRGNLAAYNNETWIRVTNTTTN